MCHLFAAHQKFGPESGDSWTYYIEWSGLRQVDEIVSTDELLCPAIIDELTDEDWNHNIQEDYKVFFFSNFEYLKTRVAFDPAKHNLLAITERPMSQQRPIDGFEFCGYDILDSYDSISVLTNCGGFPSVFRVEEMNRFGLLDDVVRANQIAEALRTAQPTDDHCMDCKVWFLSRYIAAK